MSWNGFKKAINRAGTQVMVKAGQIDESVDKEYEFEEKRFKAMENSSNKLHRELKHYIDSLRILSSAQVNVAEMLSSFYGIQNLADEQNQKSNLSQEYFEVMKGINDETLGDLEDPYNQTVMNPISRFTSYFIDINEAIKKRNHKKLDYDAMKTKVRKLLEKSETSEQQVEVKLNESQAKLSEAEQIYNNINDQLKQDLPRLVDLRIPFLDPSFESFVKIQLRFFSDNFDRLNKFQMKLDARTREDYINGSLDDRLDDILKEMKGLNITSN